MYIIRDLTKSGRTTYHIRDAKDAKDIVIGITGNELYGCEILNVAVNMRFGDQFLRPNLYSILCVMEECR